MAEKTTEKEYKYKFSFVMPVYNVEDYLAETIESILAQTMDFEQNCEIILVNDGSKDNSEEVCLRYKDLFPNNITYIKQKNSGPGAARNRGISEARGKYISLLDSDDKLSPNTLEEVYNFIEKHYDEIDLVGIKWELFEARRGGHPLNYKFTSDRVIDLEVEYSSIIGSCAPAFFKQEVLRKHKFDPSVGKYSEDARLMGEILLDNPKYGIVTKPTYFYRKRLSQTSSQDTNMTDKFWYLETPKRAFYDLFKYARKHHKDIPKFIQYMAMYDLQWRYKQKVQTVLDGKELDLYKSLLDGLLPDISDEIILAQRQINTYQKLFILGRKYGENVLANAKKKGYKYFYRGTRIYDKKDAQPAIHIEIMEAEGAALRIEGYYSGLLLGSENLLFRVGNKNYIAETIGREQRRQEFLGELVSKQNYFRIVLDVNPGDEIKTLVSSESEILPFVMHRFSYFNEAARKAYRVCGSWLIRKEPLKLSIQQHTPLRRFAYELAYMGLLAKRLKLRVVLREFSKWREAKEKNTIVGQRDLKWLSIPVKSVYWNIYAVVYRLAYFLVRPFYRRPIWLLSDRIMAADDSGEILFRYLQSQPNVPANVYFAISKKSSEYASIKKSGGKVLNYGSFRHKLLFLLSNKVISSEATDYVTNLFGKKVGDFIDLYNFDFVFLQHGIIRDDISGWLNRFNKNIKLFVTSTKPEYESILNGNYEYDESVVKLTGLPRYDWLRNKPKNKLIIMPTWRENLVGGNDPKTGYRLYNPNFKDSEYFTFYQRLMDDERLRLVMRKHDMKGEFYLHPSFQQQIVDFDGNDCFKVEQMPFDYPKAKREGNLLVTDYSSVAFDFAYLKKPVIYTHFDEDSFYKLHTSNEGYFVYEKDGFGPVAYDYETTIDEIVNMIEKKCKMSKIYQKRVEKFFYKFDRNNSKRVYEAILVMDNGR